MKDIMPRHREAALLAMQTGFAAPMKRHTALFYRRSSQTLVVTFDNHDAKAKRLVSSLRPNQLL
jgi:hypothetical protein